MTTLDTIKAKIDDLISLFMVFSKEVEDQAKRQTMLDQQERDNRLFEKDLLVKEEQLAIKEEEQKKEKEFIEEANRKIAVREMNATDDKQLLKDINEAKKEFEQRKQEAFSTKGCRDKSGRS
jgi:hypothetical protein